jgi:hypothetical protein
MTISYTLRLSGNSVDKAEIETILSKLNYQIGETEPLSLGFRTDDPMESAGFSIAFIKDDPPFGYEDTLLDEPFDFQTAITCILNMDLDRDVVVDNVTSFLLSVVKGTNENVLLTLNGEPYLLRLEGNCTVNKSAGIWHTPTGQAFLAQTPHKFFSDEQ